MVHRENLTDDRFVGLERNKDPAAWGCKVRQDLKRGTS